MKPVRVKLAEGGRVVIPSEFRKVLGVHVGDTLIVSLLDNELHLFTPREAIRQFQEYVRQFVPPERSLVDEFIADRHAEAERE
jgi:AbrB family looped-hinge helix DNA binding protein